MLLLIRDPLTNEQRAIEDAKERIASDTAIAHKQQIKLMAQQQQQAAGGNDGAVESSAPQRNGSAPSIIRTRRTANPLEVSEGGGVDVRNKGSAHTNAKRQADKNLSAVLNDTLADTDVRTDFVTIVRDMEQRAAKFSDSYREVQLSCLLFFSTAICLMCPIPYF